MPQYTPNRPIVELDHVDARIAATAVLHDVSLRIVKGVHTGIIGPNGSGKSTLLRLLSGSLWPAPGNGRRRFYFDGRTYSDAVLAKQRIALTGPELQDSYFRLGWNFSALDVVLTGLHHTEIPRRKSNAKERATGFGILEKLGGSELATRSFLELSRGEQSRVLIARAIAFNPELLLLDEPSSGLDAESRGTLDNTIRQAAKHTTIVVSAHDADQLPSIVEKIYTVVDCTVREYKRAPTQTNPGQTAPGQSRAGPATRYARSQLNPDKQKSQPEIQDAPLIDIKNANIYVGNRCVLKRLNWQLLKDRHWLVTGRNGSGKSTFLRLLHGQIRPALGGRISWPGLGNPANIWQLRRLIAWVGPEFQSRYRYPTTVFGCIASGLTASIGQTRSLSDVESHACEALMDQFELRSYRDRLLASLSYGQARRALLARTLISKPAVLLLDEPWDGLDARNIELIAGVMNQQAATGVQIVCATHTGAENLVFTDHLEIADGLIHVDELV